MRDGLLINKHISIIMLIERLETVVGYNSFSLIDHWDIDQYAIGICSNDNPRKLIYISTSDKSAGNFYYECEKPFGLVPDEFEVVAPVHDSTFEELVEVIKMHLNID